MLCDTCKTECSRNRKEVNACMWYEPKTNADRIRAMTDEELAMQFADFEYRVTKAVCALFGVDITTVEHDFEAAAKEHLELLQQPAEGEE